MASNSPQHDANGTSALLSKPLLHARGFYSAVTDEEVVGALEECLRVRLTVPREGKSRFEELSGVIEFEKLHNAEKAYATLQDYSFAHSDSFLRLSMSEDRQSDPQPSARVLIVKNLMDDTPPGAIFDLFRPYGPVFRVAPHVSRGSGGAPVFAGTAIVHLYDERQAVQAQKELHMTEYDGMTITVEEYDARKDRSGRFAATVTGGPTASWAQQRPFTPKGGGHGSPAPSPSMTRQLSSGIGLQGSRWAVPPSPAASHPSPPQMTRSGSLQAGDIDPCNLILTNLDPNLDSKDLFNAFRRFGTIVSARVMKNGGDGSSREFGFVSFTTEEAASNALREMNGAPLGIIGRRIAVAHHVLRKPYRPAQASAGDASTGQQGSQVPSEPVVSDAMARLRMATPPSSTGTPAILEPPIDLDASPSNPTVPLTATSERDRLLTAVLGLPKPGDRLEEIVDLLMGLSSRERKLCLFNAQHLTTKVAEAREVLEATDEPAVQASQPLTPPVPSASLPTPEATPARPATAAASPVYLTHEDLAKLPATEIMRLVTTSSALVKPGLLPGVDAGQRDAVDGFVDSLNGQSEPVRKQKVGEKLFQVLKAQGIKKASAPAVALVDNEDLRALAHVMESYPEIVRAKAVQMSSQAA